MEGVRRRAKRKVRKVRKGRRCVEHSTHLRVTQQQIVCELKDEQPRVEVDLPCLLGIVARSARGRWVGARDRVRIMALCGEAAGEHLSFGEGSTLEGLHLPRGTIGEQGSACHVAHGDGAQGGGGGEGEGEGEVGGSRERWGGAHPHG